MKRISILIASAIFSFFQAYTQNGARLQTAWVINDDFSNNNNHWYEDSTESYELHVKNKNYSLWNKDTSGRLFVHTFTQIFESNDYMIEASVEHNTGAEDKGNGLLIGADVLLKNYYRFLISRDGAFIIDKIENKSESILQDWKFSSAINNGKANTLSIVKFGNHWSFRINDVIVYSADAMPFFGNHHGFYIASSSGINCNLFKIYDLTLAKADANTAKENIYRAVFYDNFKNNYNDWDIKQTESETTSINNSFLIQNKTEGCYVSWQTMTISDILNHRIEIAMQHTEGVDDRAFGMCFGVKDVNNIYMFCISADGSFLVGEFVDGEYKKINDWTKSDEINNGNYSTNTLAFEKTDKWYFYINGKLVYSCEPKEYFGNKFGLYVENKQTVEFKSIKLSEITKL